jgi:hypothetical protein
MSDVQSAQAPKVVRKSKTASTSDQTLTRTRAPAKPKPHPPAVAAYVPYVSAFAIGDHISHPQFGDGTVTGIDEAKLTISFASRGIKQIIDYYVRHRKAA